MARLLAVFLVVISAPYVATAEDKAGLCPKTAPTSSSSTTCTDNAGCPTTQKCCTYNNNRRCVDPVIPNYQASLYIVALPQASNEETLITNFIENTFADVGEIGDLVVERFGTCVRVFLSLQTNQEGRVDIKMAALENDPVSIPNFKGGPFHIISARNDTVCPDAVPNFNSAFYILGVNGTVTASEIKATLDGLIGSLGKGWEFGNQTVGPCIQIFLEAVLTAEELATVSGLLDNLEENGLTLRPKEPPFTVTSNNDDAASCYQSYFRNDCENGKRFCPYRKHCILESAFCDGNDDCGDMSDERNCKCGVGKRACANRQFCLTERAFCDGKPDCEDMSDEANCYFEVYSANVTLQMAWSSMLEDKTSIMYTQVESAVKTYMNNALLPLSNYSYAKVLGFREAGPGLTVLTVTATFKGHMNASQLLMKQAQIKDMGIFYGFVNFAIESIVPAKLGPCLSHVCGSGLCVVANDEPHCRCLPGQAPMDCAPVDCRGADDYCGTENPGKCVYAPHKSAFVCHCPIGFSGQHCDIDVCSHLGGNVCSLNGVCVGDMFNFTLCSCDDNFFGPFCGERGFEMSTTLCQRQSQLANKLLQHLNGSGQVSNDFLNGNSLPQQLQTLGYQNLEVPTCYRNERPNNGYYHHMCIYNFTNVTGGRICYCTDDNGTYNGLDYINGQCRLPSTFDPEEKPGRCPTAEAGIAVFECSQDSECQGVKKCCRIGTGRQCKSPLTVKPGECPVPQSGVTVRRCDSDGDCDGTLKCCTEGRGHVCRYPVYVTRFQVEVTLNAQWRERYSDLTDTNLVSVHTKLTAVFADLKGFQGVTLLFARSGSVKVTVEVVGSPEVSRQDVQRKLSRLTSQQVRFDGMMRLFARAELVVHDFCGGLGCGTGTCVNTTRGARCLCSEGFYGEGCQFTDPCNAGVCQNGGTCASEPKQGTTGLIYLYTCLCPPGHMGSTCEVSVCAKFPTGLCNSGTCVGDLNGGILCSCPLDRRGIFCQDNGTEIPYTECERRRRLNDYTAEVLKGRQSMAGGLTATGLQTVLRSLGMEWLPLFTCQHGGSYSLTARMLSVTDRSTVRYVCLDKDGKEEVNCESKVCSALSGYGSGSLCQNNGSCSGNINLQLCNCTGTGHHGAICEKPGEEDATECEQKHALAQLTLGALSGTLLIQGLTGSAVKSAISTLLSDIHRDDFWQPDCTRGGSYAFRGCQFQVSDVSSKECFCVDEHQERLANVPSSRTGLPECPLAGACSAFTSDPCGDHGKCIGDLNAGALCECDADYSGIMCQINSPTTATECQRRSELSNHLLGVMHGFKQPPRQLSGSVHQLLIAASISRLEVPTCDVAGLYRYICTYRVSNLQLDGCRCTNSDGTYVGGARVKSCEDIAKPGECPAAGGVVGIAVQQCDNDLDCKDSMKCCSIGAGHQCRDPVYVSLFRVNMTVNAPWKSEYSNLRSSSMTSLRTQLEDVFRTVTGFVSVTIITATQGIKLSMEVKASAEVTAEDIQNGLTRLRAAELSIGGKMHGVDSATYITQDVCEGVQCGPGRCVDTSFGAKCVCPQGTSGDRCQYSVQACNCSVGQQCLRGSQPGALACACYPENDAACRLPLWFCQGKADCSGSEKCVHKQDCAEDCEVKSRCIPLDEAHACDDQPCQHGGLCVTRNDGSFTCQCKPGFEGPRCERNQDVCSVVPTRVCTHGCVGDAHVGVLCQCPSGRGGINCDQPAHSRCEQQRALFTDMMKISKSQLTVPLVTQAQLSSMMTRIMAKIEAKALPLTNCSADGGFTPVQCQVAVGGGEETCWCVDKDGAPFDSNVKAYPGFPPCTAPYSPEVTGQMLCSSSLSSVCRNGGTCVGNLFNGSMCQCPPAFTGIFCQDRRTSGQSADAPRSLCEFSLAVWQLMREATQSGDRSLLPQLQVLQSKLFHADTNMPGHMVKASCTPDGQFQSVQCTFSLRTDQPLHCYCINPTGVILASKTAWPQTPDCDGVTSCPRRACGVTQCEHGLARDIHGCETCQCRHPCDGQCGQEEGVRCVVETQEDCGRDGWQGACTSGICRQRQKPGMCPVSVSANMTSLNTLKSSRISSCDVSCLDDADCPANLKCCGVCGTRCVQPVGERTCSSHRVGAIQEFQYMKSVQEALDKGEIILRNAPRILRAKLVELREQRTVWVPTCDTSGFYQLTQCKTLIKQAGGTGGGCFCVDRHGNRIAGTNAATKSKTNCDAKPGVCPFLQPNASAVHSCQNDYGCQDDLKCCSHGLGFQCIAPLKPQPGQAVSLDNVINSMCSFAANACGRKGACVRRWYTEGRVCSCTQGNHGPFCQIAGPEPGDVTPCRRRKAMQDLLMSNANKLSLFLKRVRRSGGTSAVKLTFSQCLPDGRFAPKQCSEDVDTRQKVDCFCVDSKGKPLGGTNVPADQTPQCARSNPCDLGAPLHAMGNGSVVRCGSQAGQCPPGYLCRAGQYAQLFCCRDRLSEVDVCRLPPSPGGDCAYYDAGTREITQQRFYYDARSKRCRAFTYKGCADHNPNFPTKAACEARCARKEHQGRCPAKTEVAARAVCSDSCGSDADCREEQKCCSTSCGRRCVLALNSEDAVCEIGQPLLDMESGQPQRCSTNQDCGPGYRCRSRYCCLRRMDKACQQPQVRGPCKAHLIRYFYNWATRQCQSFVYGGCGANDNNFLTKDQCCNACEETGRCKDGFCPAPRPVLSVSCDRSCYGDGDCPADQICCNSSCGGSSCVIAKLSTEAALSCRERLADYLQQMKNTKGCFLRPRPRCDSDGSWLTEQCNDKLGVCWCVTPNGFVVPKTRVRGVAQCQWVTPAMMEAADRKGMRGDDKSDDDEECQVCPAGEQVQCCNEDLCLQVCPSDPAAVCRINPCGECRAVFYNSENQVVNCTAGLTACQLHRHTALQVRHRHRLVAMATHSRQSKMAPDLRTPGAAENQVPYFVDGIPSRCHLQPDSGTCRAHTPQWFYNVTSQQCQVFVYGLCGGNDNRFHTPEDCYRQCNPDASPCSGKGCRDGKVCQLKYSTDCFSGTCGLTTQCRVPTALSQVSGVHVPQCQPSGVYAPRQCHGHVCWCVNGDGTSTGGLTSDPTTLKCDSRGPLRNDYTRIECPGGGGDASVDCIDNCRDAVCPGQTSARCVLDLCTCQTRFVGTDGRPVTCKSDRCQTDVFTRAVNSCPSGKVCNGRGPRGCEYQDPCTSAVCPSNPCAVCVSDPCTGRVRFVDKLTGTEQAQEACNTIQHTSCQLRQCEVMSINARAQPNDTLLLLPDCEDDGSYKPHQHRPDGTSYCVNDFGEAVEESETGCVKDPIVSISVVVIYDGVFDDIVPGREDKIVVAFTDLMEQIGLLRAMVTNVRILRGSIMIQTEIVNNPQSNIDIAVVKPLIQSKAASGELTLRVDGLVLKVVGGGGVQITPTTASQVQAAPVAQGGIGTGGVVAIVVVLLLVAGVAGAVAFYFLYYKRRNTKKEADNTDSAYQDPRSGKNTGQTEGVDNNAYSMYDSIKPKKKSPTGQPDFVEEPVDDHYVKVRL